jgi:hypothetical protein
MGRLQRKRLETFVQTLTGANKPLRMLIDEKLKEMVRRLMER